MLSMLVASAFLTALPPAPSVSDDEKATYQAACDHAGRDPEAHVKLALWCERLGMEAERLRHLALAVMADPQNAAARGLLGMVKDRDGDWVKSGQAAKADRQDPKLFEALGEYNRKRTVMDDHDADDHWKLAIWCEGQGLKAEALAHFAAVVRLEPGRAAAWKRLGCKKVDGRWMNDEQAAAEKAEREAQKAADRAWSARLEELRRDLADPRERAGAEQELSRVSNPRAVPSIWKVFVRGRNPSLSRAVQLLGQVRSPASSKALAWLVVGSKSETVRQRATETLETRDAREFLDILIGALRQPVRYQVRPVRGPGQPGTLYIEGRAYNTMEVFRPWNMPRRALRSGDYVTLDANGLPVINEPSLTRLSYPGVSLEVTRDLEIPIGEMQLEAIQTAVVAERQLERQVALLDRLNQRIGAWNERVLPALTTLTGQDLGAEAQAWSKWWTEEQGYAYSPPPEPPRPTLVEDVPLAYQPPPIRPEVVTGQVVGVTYHHSCFARGTLVRTRNGLKPIESVHLGDQVLTQDGSTGKMAYQPVIFTHHNPPSPTLRISLDGGESVVATPIHRFWKAGKGWAMARDLKPGDIIRSVDGLARVDAISNERVQPVFNLEVASGQSFFVGTAGLLVHDNSLVEPVAHPFDRPALLASAVDRE